MSISSLSSDAKEARAIGSGFRSLGFRVQCLGFRGLGFREAMACARGLGFVVCTVLQKVGAWVMDDGSGNTLIEG